MTMVTFLLQPRQAKNAQIVMEKAKFGAQMGATQVEKYPNGILAPLVGELAKKLVRLVMVQEEKEFQLDVLTAGEKDT